MYIYTITDYQCANEKMTKDAIPSQRHQQCSQMLGSYVKKAQGLENTGCRSSEDNLLQASFRR